MRPWVSKIWQTQLSTLQQTNMLCSVVVYDGKVLTGYSSDIGSSEIACLDAETGAVAEHSMLVC